MLVDLDYFFAQCEELRNPSIKDKPVVICVYSGRSADSGAVSTANYVARKYGVRSGIPIYLAKKKLENLEAVFLPVDYEFYENVSQKVMAVLRGFADIFEQMGVDEAFLDVTERTKADFRISEDLAGTIKDELVKRLQLTCSIGVGPNKLVAKIAADERKPAGLTVVTPNQVSSFLQPLPVDRLIGVGKKTLMRMQSMHICTIGELAKTDVQKLVSVFGKTLGTYFYDASHGADNEPVQEKGETESISRIATLRQNTRDVDVVMEKATGLCDDLYNRVLEERLTFKTIGIIAITVDLKTYSRSRSLDSPSNSVYLMKRTARELFEKFIEDSELDIRRVGVKLSNLAVIEEAQARLTRFFESA
jgi:DNA polymerase IV (DinB-like DNA polymerase)